MVLKHQMLIPNKMQLIGITKLVLMHSVMKFLIGNQHLVKIMA